MVQKQAGTPLAARNTRLAATPGSKPSWRPTGVAKTPLSTHPLSRPVNRPQAGAANPKSPAKAPTAKGVQASLSPVPANAMAEDIPTIKPSVAKPRGRWQLPAVAVGTNAAATGSRRLFGSEKEPAAGVSTQEEPAVAAEAVIPARTQETLTKGTGVVAVVCKEEAKGATEAAGVASKGTGTQTAAEPVAPGLCKLFVDAGTQTEALTAEAAVQTEAAAPEPTVNHAGMAVQAEREGAAAAAAGTQEKPGAATAAASVQDRGRKRGLDEGSTQPQQEQGGQDSQAQKRRCLTAKKTSTSASVQGPPSAVRAAAIAAFNDAYNALEALKAAVPPVPSGVTVQEEGVQEMDIYSEGPSFDSPKMRRPPPATPPSAPCPCHRLTPAAAAAAGYTTPAAHRHTPVDELIELYTAAKEKLMTGGKGSAERDLNGVCAEAFARQPKLPR